MGRKKQFIKKGEGVKFYLVHRSQKDPLFLDENLGEHVLVPADPNACDDDFIKSVNGMSLNAREKSYEEREEIRRKRIEEQHKYGIFYSDDYDYLQHLKEVDAEEKASMEEFKEIKVGSVLIKDKLDDDYEAQFADVDANNNNIEKSRLQLPSTVFASKFEEEIGYMNQAAPDHDPKINWDPDIVKLLDESSDVELNNEENEFEDDFFIKANSEQPVNCKSDAKKKNKVKSYISEPNEDDEENEDEDEDDEEEEEEEEEENDSTLGFNDYYESESVRDFETKSRFSNYSMSSSIIRRNEGLRQLDDHFEKVFAEYDEDQIGSLDTDEIDGFRHSDDLTLKAALEEFQKLTEKNTLDFDSNTKIKKVTTNVNKKSKSKLGVLVEESEETEENNINLKPRENGEEEEEENQETSSEETTSEDEQKEIDYEIVRFTQKKTHDDRFDCESIVSTYSNLYNRPAIINDQDDHKIKLSKKTGLPLGVLPEKPMSKHQMDKIEHKITRILPEIPQRKENETKEEKKLRKQVVKEHRRERRVEKKINKMAFKSEKAKQTAQMNRHAEVSHSVKILL
jgi:protein LTV1